MLTRMLCVLTLMFFHNNLVAQHAVDSLLITREQAKWDAFNNGDFGKYKVWFSESFFSIGYMPDTSVYRTQDNNKKVLNPGMPSFYNKPFPKAVFTLSDFHVVAASEDVRIVTYIANGILDLFATSVWAKKEGEWKSIFYQATAYKKLI